MFRLTTQVISKANEVRNELATTRNSNIPQAWWRMPFKAQHPSTNQTESSNLAPYDVLQNPNIEKNHKIWTNIEEKSKREWWMRQTNNQTETKTKWLLNNSTYKTKETIKKTTKKVWFVVLVVVVVAAVCCCCLLLLCRHKTQQRDNSSELIKSCVHTFEIC